MEENTLYERFVKEFAKNIRSDDNHFGQYFERLRAIDIYYWLKATEDNFKFADRATLVVVGIVSFALGGITQVILETLFNAR